MRVNAKRHLVFFVLITELIFALLAYGQDKTQTAVSQAPIPINSFKYDLDGMVKRRVIRVLTVYSKMFYFVDAGQPRGLVYEIFKKFETDLNAKLKTGTLPVHVVFFAVSRDQLLPRLAAGYGDIAAANLTITPERLKTVDFSVPLLKGINELVITGPDSPKVSTLEDLAGKEFYVRKSSSYHDSLMALNDRFKKEGKPLMIIKDAPEDLEDEDLLEMLNAGLIKFLLVDSHIADFWKQIFTKITVHTDLVVRQSGDIGWAFRKDSPKLAAELNPFIEKNGKGTLFGNTMMNRYLKSVKYVKSAASEEELKKFDFTVDLFRKYASEYSVDYLLMTAKGYQESRLDQNVKSQVGAIGVMQVMPATGNEMKVGDIHQMDANIHAGVKYMRFMQDQYFKNEPMTDFNKLIFAFASYNAGPGRIRGLRAEAAKRGYDPNIWFNNVEIIASEKIGRETVTYVSNIYKYYLAYRLIQEEAQERKKAMEQIKHK